MNIPNKDNSLYAAKTAMELMIEFSELTNIAQGAITHPMDDLVLSAFNTRVEAASNLYSEIQMHFSIVMRKALSAHILLLNATIDNDKSPVSVATRQDYLTEVQNTTPQALQLITTFLSQAMASQERSATNLVTRMQMLYKIRTEMTDDYKFTGTLGGNEEAYFVDVQTMVAEITLTLGANGFLDENDSYLPRIDTPDTAIFNEVSKWLWLRRVHLAGMFNYFKRAHDRSLNDYNYEACRQITALGLIQAAEFLTKLPPDPVTVLTTTHDVPPADVAGATEKQLDRPEITGLAPIVAMMDESADFFASLNLGVNTPMVAAVDHLRYIGKLYHSAVEGDLAVRYPRTFKLIQSVTKDVAHESRTMLEAGKCTLDTIRHSLGEMTLIVESLFITGHFVNDERSDAIKQQHWIDADERAMEAVADVVEAALAHQRDATEALAAAESLAAWIEDDEEAARCVQLEEDSANTGEDSPD